MPCLIAWRYYTNTMLLSCQLQAIDTTRQNITWVYELFSPDQNKVNSNLLTNNSPYITYKKILKHIANCLFSLMFYLSIDYHEINFFS